MILDKKLLLANAQAVTTATAHDSESVIDFGAHGDPAYPLTLVAQVDAPATSSGSATVSFGLATSDNNADYTTLWTSAAIPVASLVAGLQIKVPVPTGMRRYAKGLITVGVAALTGGTFSLFMVSTGQTNAANV